MEETDSKRRRNPYRIRCERTWTRIRARYLAGESAPRLADVFDVTVAAIRARARRKGWTKRAFAEATPVEPADAGLAEAVAEHRDGELTATEAARVALGEAVKLLREGRMTLAGEAARVADVMARAAGRLDGTAPEDPGEPDEAAFEAVRRKVMGWDLAAAAEADGEDGPGNSQERTAPAEGVSWGSSADTAPPPPGGCAACPPHSPDANGEVSR